ncbi:MAG: amidohydrolase family protein [Verrucomicrobiota bacterium]
MRLILILSLSLLTSASPAIEPLDKPLLIHGGTIVPMEPDQRDPIDGWMLVGVDGTIQELAAGEPDPKLIETSESIDASGKIIIPGFISAHSHLWSAPFRGIASESNLLDWIEAAHSPFTPYYQDKDFYIFTQYGALDFLSHGITTCYNWVWNNGWDYEHWIEQFEAQLSIDQRFIFGWALDVTDTEEANRTRLKAFLEEAKTLKAENPHLLKASLSALGMLFGDTELPYWEGKLMKDFGLDAQAHYLEDPAIKHRQQGEFSIMEKAGMICDQLHLAHFIHTNDHILQKSSDAGVRMVWNPLSNGRLGSGLADIPKYKQFGLQIAMGLDGQASGDLSDPFENMRMGLYATRMKYESAGVMTPYQILALHTYESAKTLKVEDRVGSLSTGKFADFLILNPQEPDVGPVIDIYATLVMTLSTRNLEAVYVGGQAVYSEGDFTKHDFPNIRDEAHTRVERMIEQLKSDGQPVPTATYLNHYSNP